MLFHSFENLTILKANLLCDPNVCLSSLTSKTKHGPTQNLSVRRPNGTHSVTERIINQSDDDGDG